VRTEDTATGSLTISDLCVNGHDGSVAQGLTSHRFMTMFHWRCHMLGRDLHVNRREWGGSGSHFHAPPWKASGNAAGRVYIIPAFYFHAAAASMNAEYRHVLFTGTSRPLAVYQPDCEGAHSPVQAEIVNCQNVTWYSFKHEPGTELIDIRNCNNVCILGGSGNYQLGTGAVYDVINTTNFVVAMTSKQGDPAAAGNTAPFLREDGVVRFANDRRHITMIKRGDPTPYGELILS
jgi:hypothetical protein